jgi:transcriptional repressor NrdR
MVCLYCGSPTEVKNSRQQRRGTYIWRRRKCKECGSIFTTRESTTLDEALMVETSSSKLEPFNRDKLFLAIYASCRHRATNLVDATALTQTIIEQLIKTQHGGKISVDSIVHCTHIALSRFDPTAATFYAAYHTRVRSA